nr:GGDEF domain-containing protein [Treponema sp.]
LQLGAAFLSWGAEHGFTFYRYGGEEFIAVGNQSDYSWLGEQAESLRKAIQELAIPFPQNSPGVVTISLGYAPQTDFRNYEETIKLADEALYTAKRTGRNRVCGSITEQAPAGRA